jgi:predicted O-linked N-acetylglucosamine transferase (SPINDLY family)
VKKVVNGFEIPDYSHLLRYHTAAVALPSGRFEWGYHLSVEAEKQARSKNDRADALSDQGVCLDRLGFYREASKRFRKSGELYDRPIVWMNLAVADDHDPATTPAIMQQTRKRLRASMGDPEKLPELLISEIPEKINIGYVSGDFRQHSAASCNIGMLRYYNRDRFKVHLFSSTPPPGDHQTEVYRQIGASDGGFYDLPSDDRQAANLIRSKNIHILIDLSGVSGYNRLSMFTLRPAPIQVTAWGYATSTGLPEMDYFMCCPVMVPDAEAPYYIEELWRISRSTHFAFPAAKENWPVRVRRPGPPSFGWLGRMAKVSDDILRVWAKIINKSPPETVIRFKDTALDSPMGRGRVHEILTKEGVDPNRVLMAGLSDRAQHIAAYSHIDVMLDSWPENGGVTTMECLLSGVPMVTMTGPTPGSRGGKLTLTPAGFGHWVARDAQDYIDIALDHMANREKHDRNLMREAIIDGPLFDDKTYVKEIEGVYEAMLKERIGGKKPNWIERKNTTA